MARLLLPPYAAFLVREVEARTGYPIRISGANAIGFDMQVRLARPGQPSHDVSYVPAYRQFAVHFLVNAARKVLRVYDAPADDRYVAAHRGGRRLPLKDEKDLRRSFPIPETELQGISTFLFDGTVRQLTSFPVDLRVERELYEDLPEHRPLQRAYLRRQVEDIEPHFLPQVAAIAPPRIYAASTAMNVVLAEEAAELAGYAIGPLVRASPHRSKGERLRQLLDEEIRVGHIGDRDLTDAWAEELGLRDWYEWMPLPPP